MNIVNRTISKYKYLRDIFLGKYFPRILANRLYIERTGNKKGIDWQHPKDLNEKINWLKFNSNTFEWTKLADKYQVREFVKERGCGDTLVELYGVCDEVDQIDFESLPKSFVVKTNNGSGGVWIVKDKDLLDITKLRKEIKESFNDVFGYLYAEPHYVQIKPKIIIEELLQEQSAFYCSLVDYKIWCFDGNVFGTWACYNRKGYTTSTEWHDLEWNFRPEWSIFNDHYKDGKGHVTKPKNYDLMLDIAMKLSKGFPQVRVDLYNIDGKVYFGEMTFTSAGGYMNFYSQLALDKMGDMTIIQ